MDHPDFAVPARRALAGLAAALLGYGTDVPAPNPPRGAAFRRTRQPSFAASPIPIASPPFIVVRDTGEATSGDERRRLRVIPTQPAGLLIASASPALTENSWSFVAGRALETLRSGLRTSGLAGAEGLARLLEGARAVLADAADRRAAGPRRRRLAAHAGAALLLGSPETRADICVDVEAALAALPDWPTFTRGAQHTRNRIGLLACTSPADALTVLKADDRGVPVGRDTNTPEGRQAFLRNPVARELIEFMLSPACEAAFAPDPEEPHEGFLDIGIVGLGVMGQNLALNIDDKGFSGRRLGRLAGARSTASSPRPRRASSARLQGARPSFVAVAAPAAPDHPAGQGGRGRRQDHRRAAAAPRARRHARRRRQRVLPEHRAPREGARGARASASSAWASRAARRARATARR